ncbi:hypothetical protein E1J02_17750 [Phocaeicola dorei]|nr:hypothetical protein E1J02_17750 [Phocaeicola dorei]
MLKNKGYGLWKNNWKEIVNKLEINILFASNLFRNLPLRSILTVICKIMIMDNVTGMSIQEYAAMRELECEHKKGWGATAAIWVIAAVIVIAFFVYSWHINCNEKVQFAVGWLI